LKNLQRTTSLVWILIYHAALVTPANLIYIYLVLDNHEVHNPEPIQLYNFFYVLYVLGHCINHILYCMTNKQIQEETSKILFQCKNIYWSRT